MTLRVALVTGYTGFLGQKFVQTLKQRGLVHYSEIAGVDRDKHVIKFSDNEKLSFLNFAKQYAHMTFDVFHFATHYNPKPNNLTECKSILEANILFPLSLIENIEDLGRIISLQSYHELLPEQFQTEYSLSKRLVAKIFATHARDFTEIFLFDNFGSEDRRNKVVDVFISKCLENKDLQIPKNEVDINLCSADNVVRNIIDIADLECGRYVIGNTQHISLSALAELIIGKCNTSSKLTRSGQRDNFLDYIDAEVQNFIGYDNTQLSKDLETHILERQAKINIRSI